MDYVPSFLVIFAAPLDRVAVLQQTLLSAILRLGNDVEQIPLTQRLGPEGGDYDAPAYLMGALTVSEAEIALPRPSLRPGGDLHDLGCRARCLLFGAKEIAAPGTAPGKLTVEVIEALPIPEGVDWSATRVTREAFEEELGELAGAPLVVLEPPAEVI